MRRSCKKLLRKSEVSLLVGCERRDKWCHPDTRACPDDRKGGISLVDSSHTFGMTLKRFRLSRAGPVPYRFSHYKGFSKIYMKLYIQIYIQFYIHFVIQIFHEKERGTTRSFLSSGSFSAFVSLDLTTLTTYNPAHIISPFLSLL